MIVHLNFIAHCSPSVDNERCCSYVILWSCNDNGDNDGVVIVPGWL